MLFRLTVCCVLLVTLCRLTDQSTRTRRQGFNVGSGESCVTPRNIEGMCINIKECPLHIDYLVNGRQQPDIVEYLRQAVCRRQGSQIITCCPILEKSVNFESGDKCQTPRKVAGTCINIRQCPELLAMLQRYKEQGVTNYLRQSQCGFNSGDPLVCCPLSTGGNSGGNNGGNTGGNTGVNSGGSNGVLPGTDVCGRSGDMGINRVVNGQPASLGSWPWMVALGYRSSKKSLDWLCGGTLISDRFILTAAHCVTNIGTRTLYLARLGDLNLDDQVQDRASPIDMDVEKSIPHENYNPTAHTVDIALVKLRDRVQFTKMIRPICLPSTNTFRSDLTGYSPFVIGWGATSFRGPSATHLQEAQIDITDMGTCSNAYKGIKGATIDNRVICALSPDGKDACQGDSGGPLILPKSVPSVNYYLIGVVSYGYKCAEPGFPGIYTKVALYLDWIKKNMS